MQTLKEDKENSTQHSNKVQSSTAQKTASELSYNWLQKLSDLTALAAACVVVLAQDMFVSRLAAGAYITVLTLQFASAQRMVAKSDRTPEEKRKVSNALRVVGTFMMVVACVVLALSLVVPFSLQIVGILVAIKSIQTMRKRTRRAKTGVTSR